VADFARHIRGAVIQLAVNHEAAADPGTDREPDHVTRALCGAAPPFAKRRAVGVVVERDRQAHAMRDRIAQREVAPAQVGRDDDEASLAVEWPWRTHADPQEVPGLRAVLRDRIRHHLRDHGDDAVHHRFGAAFRVRGFRADSDFATAILGHGPDHDVGTAQVDADDVLRAGTGHVRIGGEAWIRVRGSVWKGKCMPPAWTSG